MQIRKLPIRLAPYTLAAALGATRLIACQAEVQKPTKPIIDAFTPRVFTCTLQRPIFIGGFDFPSGSMIKTSQPPQKILAEAPKTDIPVNQYKLADEFGQPWHVGKRGNYQLTITAGEIKAACPEQAWTSEYLLSDF